MNSVLATLALAVCVGVIMIVPDHAAAAAALVLCSVVAAVAAYVISTIKLEKQFLLQLFLGALLVRIVLGTLINVFELQDFFGGDAYTYDFYGTAVLKALAGDRYYAGMVERFQGQLGGGAVGMIYMVAAIYKILGKNPLAVQFFNSVLGAATAPIIFLIAHSIFGNLRVARIAALFVAFFPSLVLWSSQGLKDGPIVFMLALAVVLTLRLGERFNIKNAAFLLVTLAALTTFRFYLFYMVVASIVGAFTIGMREFTATSFFRQLLLVIGIGLGLTYFGIIRTANLQLDYYGDLANVQRSRLDLATSAKSGFGEDVDVSTASGALQAVPTGILYLIFAPFPWQLQSLRQSITLPEMLVWWSCFPFLVMGLWFTFRYRLRQAFVIFIFTTMLTIAYSVFQGNVGTAYRQRAQILVFYFIFVAVGIVLTKEKWEERRLNAAAERAKLAANMGVLGQRRPLGKASATAQSSS
ncbi:MAG TPA: glycosyltransferase family 39 protein [Pyrinomonadaceae bacterium]|nr:glycosyltransferase family 39 protein [Pyrinomonadaceae bacterium]